MLLVRSNVQNLNVAIKQNFYQLESRARPLTGYIVVMRYSSLQIENVMFGRTPRAMNPASRSSSTILNTK